jgi:hypothetical protein
VLLSCYKEGDQMSASDQITLSARVLNGLPVYWQEFAKYYAEIGQIVITDSEKPENTG